MNIEKGEGGHIKRLEKSFKSAKFKQENRAHCSQKVATKFQRESDIDHQKM